MAFASTAQVIFVLLFPRKHLETKLRSTYIVYSGPLRFDWDHDANAWIYRRTKAKLHKLLEEELEDLCSEPIQLS